ncbi:MAG: 3D domain-containing protein [Campylobacterales bacterium]|nr:3D domain-containing protein [Campylobacterales bacterium]
MRYQTAKYFTGYLSALLLITFFLTGCAKPPPSRSPQMHPVKKEIRKMRVHSTAYTSRLKRKNAKYPVGAWGDPLTPSCRSIAVSADLLKMGLTHQSKVRIEGLEGEYVVLDRMHPKWKKKIDLYMGNDFKRARYWGVRTVTIQWEVPKAENSR